MPITSELIKKKRQGYCALVSTPSLGLSSLLVSHNAPFFCGLGEARKATVSLSHPSCCQMSICHLPTVLNHSVPLQITPLIDHCFETVDSTQWGRRLGEAGGGGLAEAPENNTPLSFHWHGEVLLCLSTPASDTFLCQAGQRFQCAVKKSE